MPKGDPAGYLPNVQRARGYSGKGMKNKKEHVVAPGQLKKSQRPMVRGKKVPDFTPKGRGGGSFNRSPRANEALEDNLARKRKKNGYLGKTPPTTSKSQGMPSIASGKEDFLTRYKNAKEEA